MHVHTQVPGGVFPATAAQGEVTPHWVGAMGLFASMSSLQGQDSCSRSRAGGWTGGRWDCVVSSGYGR